MSRPGISSGGTRNFSSARFSGTRQTFGPRNTIGTNRFSTTGTNRFSGTRNFSGRNSFSGNRHHHHHNNVVFFGGFGYPYWYDYYPYPYGYYDYGYPGAYYDEGVGDEGSSVADLQQRMAQAGYYHGAIDGIMGPETRRALRAYQRDNGSRAYSRN
jgi:hypothetical protein